MGSHSFRLRNLPPRGLTARITRGIIRGAPQLREPPTLAVAGVAPCVSPSDTESTPPPPLPSPGPPDSAPGALGLSRSRDWVNSFEGLGVPSATLRKTRRALCPPPPGGRGEEGKTRVSAPRRFHPCCFTPMEELHRKKTGVPWGGRPSSPPAKWSERRPGGGVWRGRVPGQPPTGPRGRP